MGSNYWNSYFQHSLHSNAIMLLKVIVYNGVIYKACDNECKNVDCKRLSFVSGVYSVTSFSLLPCLLVYRYGKRWKRQTIR